MEAVFACSRVAVKFLFRQGNILCGVKRAGITATTSVFEKGGTTNNRSNGHKTHWSRIEAKLPCPFCGLKFRTNDVLLLHMRTKHAIPVSEALCANPVVTYKSIFGGKDIKRINAHEMRYPDGLVVTLTGPHAGHWYSFTKGTGGGPLKALREWHNLTFMQALETGAKMVGMTQEDFRNQLIDVKRKRKISVKTTVAKLDKKDKRLKERVEVAQSLWLKSVPLKGTLGEKYLVKHRRIPRQVVERLTFRFLPQGTKYVDYDESNEQVEKELPSPVVLVPVEDVDQQVVGVQRIYLDAKTGKGISSRHKFTKGDLMGNVAVIQRGEVNNKHLYVAEGPETAASVAAAIEDNESPVLASLSVGNLGNVATVISGGWRPQSVVIASDNDGHNSPSSRAIADAIHKLTRGLNSCGIHCVTTVSPDLPEGCTKSDWNDVLQLQGIGALRRQLLSGRADQKSH